MSAGLVTDRDRAVSDDFEKGICIGIVAVPCLLIDRWPGTVCGISAIE